MPIALIALILLPAAAGSLRLLELSGGPHLMPANPRLTASPIPVIVHITPAPRPCHPKWHRLSGRVVVVLGLAVAFSALWLTLFRTGPPCTGCG